MTFPLPALWGWVGGRSPTRSSTCLATARSCATHLMLGDLPNGLDTLGLDRDRTLAAVCGSGYRSSLATSLLERYGFKDVWNTLGGMTAWKEVGLPTVDDGAPNQHGAHQLPVRDAELPLVRRAPTGSRR